MHPLIVNEIARTRRREMLARSERARLARLAERAEEEQALRAGIVLPRESARRVSLEVDEPARMT